MNLREVASISTAALFGAAVSAIAVRFFFVSPSNTTSRKHFSSVDEKIGPQCPFDPSKRKGYLSWDDYFMAIAFLSAERSKDPNRQLVVTSSCQGIKFSYGYDGMIYVALWSPVGACLVSQSGIILGIGYNGFPRGCSDDSLPWSKKSKTGNPLETKYPYVCHAEVNAILNTNHASAAGQRLYVTMFPCNECAKIIIQQSGVSEVIYFVEKRLKNSDTAYVASHKLLTLAGVKGILQRRSVEVISAENWIIQERVSGWLVICKI
ncbi:hypothetical protein RHGRI_035042 [Rhododendron griersonianum]|uniref:dCMP deaminase n=1 Tax=Rhododendron griersonianum TaxID=479676 RepID=A0AAV6I3W3_9ERIC|nr:hypothetical protein RHGRI_035042 [Rhododendron griersonianum]